MAAEWTEDDLYRLAVRLHSELLGLRERARALPYDDMDRFRLSLRAGEIGKQLKTLPKTRQP
jgi:hypothetical protein